jgi:riboflavin kinase/FMN adenylyltransferase
MKVFRGLPNDRARAPCALTIGNFDGVHRGHQALLAHVTASARRLGLESAVMTFEPHPREYFAQRSGDLSKAPARIAILLPCRRANLPSACWSKACTSNG